MPSTGRVISGTAGMAAQGAVLGSVVPGIGTLVGGLVGGAVGLIGSLFGGGKSAEEIMAERKAAAQRAVAEAYRVARTNVATEGKQFVSQASQGAARRALASGRDVSEGDVAAATGGVYRETGKAFRDLTAKEAESMAEIEAGYAARPIEEDMPLSDVLMSLGSSAASVAMASKQADVLKAQQAAADKVQVSKIGPGQTLMDVTEGVGVTPSEWKGGIAPAAVVPSTPTLPSGWGPLNQQRDYSPEQKFTSPPGQEMTQLADIGEALAPLNRTTTANSSPSAQGPKGANQAWWNRVNNNSAAKLPGPYGGLIKSIGGQFRMKGVQ